MTVYFVSDEETSFCLFFIQVSSLGISCEKKLLKTNDFLWQ